MEYFGFSNESLLILSQKANAIVNDSEKDVYERLGYAMNFIETMCTELSGGRNNETR